MKRLMAVVALAALAAGMAGCQPKGTGDGGSPETHGRFAGIGVYPAGSAWSRIAVSGQPGDVAAARTIDDEHVIVVVDSHTGEVRQCGNLSGYCIGMNPWSKGLGSAQSQPVPVTAHAQTGVSSDSAAASDAAPAAGPDAMTPNAERQHRRHGRAASGATSADDP